VPLPEQQAVVDAFFTAARAGEFDRLVELLDPDVVIRADGGTRPGASLVMYGAAEIAAAVIATASQRADFTPVLVNGVAGMLITVQGRPVSVMACTVADGRIIAIDGVTDLERLSRLGL
jgi:RNA polymerase sigma-70 factor (ECF subfamily)